MIETVKGRHVMEILASLMLCILFAVWGLGDVLFFVLLSLATVFFSVRFGIGLAISAALLTILTAMVELYMNQGAVLLDKGTVLMLARLCVMNVSALLLSVYVRRHYKQFQRRLTDVQGEQKELLQAVDELQQEKAALECEVQQLQALRAIEQVFRERDFEQVTDDMLAMLHHVFQMEEIGLYCVDESKQALHVKVRQGEAQQLPHIIYMTEAGSFYERLLTTREVTRRTVSDSGAPLLAVPLCREGQVREVLLIQAVQAYREPAFAFLHWVLQTIREHYEQAWEKERAQGEYYPGTGIHRLSSFLPVLEQAKRREERFLQPYSCIGFYIREMHRQRLPEIQQILHPYLLAPYAAAYDDRTRVLYLLLPGYDRALAGQVRKEIERQLKEENLHIVDWTMLEHELAV